MVLLLLGQDNTYAAHHNSRPLAVGGCDIWPSTCSALAFLQVHAVSLVFCGIVCRRAGGGVDDRSNEPKTFKRFLLENVPDNVNPLEAQKLYEQYLTEHFGDQLRARFEQEKTVEA